MCSVLKDMPWYVQPSRFGKLLKINAHHIFCMIGVALYVIAPPPRAKLAFVLSCVILEIGSVSSNLAGTWPQNRLFEQMYRLLMVTTNLFGVIVGAMFTYCQPLSFTTVFLMLCDVIMCWLRQQSAWTHLNQVESNRLQKATKAQ